MPTTPHNFILGRTFLQEAYLISDNDRRSFSVFPAVYPDASVDKDIVAILPLSNSSGTPDNRPSPPPAHKRKTRPLSTASIVTIACSITAVALLAIIIILLCLRHAVKRRAAGTSAPEIKKQPGELDSSDNERRIFETDGRGIPERVTRLESNEDTAHRLEMGTDDRRYEMPDGAGDDGAAEMERGGCRDTGWAGDGSKGANCMYNRRIRRIRSTSDLTKLGAFGNGPPLYPSPYQ